MWLPFTIMNLLVLTSLLQHVSSNPVLVNLLAFFINMIILAKDLPSTLQDKWNGSIHKSMTSPPKLETSKRLKPWKDIPFPYLSTKGCLTFIPLDAHLTPTLRTIPMSPQEWDHSVLDYDFTPDQEPLWSTPEVDLLLFDPMHDASGDFSQRVVANLNTILGHPATPGEYVPFSSFDCQLHQLKDADIDWTALTPYFGWTSTENIKNTLKVTTRYGPTPPSHDYLKKHFKTNTCLQHSPVQLSCHH